jgi:alpha-D-ribose 1-methylphosphonate 5-triphosphate synthase subunit PhnL
MTNTEHTSAPSPLNLKRGVATQKFRNRQAQLFQNLQSPGRQVKLAYSTTTGDEPRSDES